MMWRSLLTRGDAETSNAKLDHCPRQDDKMIKHSRKSKAVMERTTCLIGCRNGFRESGDACDILTCVVI